MKKVARRYVYSCGRAIFGIVWQLQLREKYVTRSFDVELRFGRRRLKPSLRIWSTEDHGEGRVRCSKKVIFEESCISI
jgi:hypothetical protein